MASFRGGRSVLERKSEAGGFGVSTWALTNSVEILESASRAQMDQDSLQFGLATPGSALQRRRSLDAAWQHVELLGKPRPTWLAGS